jgi:C-terminal processing protease CtpA/Prc
MLVSSCDKDLTIDTSPKADFELFIEYLKNDYAYRDMQDFTMDELREKYLPQIEANNSKQQLADILMEIMFNEIRDPHVYLKSEEPVLLSTVVERNPQDRETIAPLFDEITIRQNTEFYTSGTVKGNPEIGYLYIRAFNSDLGGSTSLGVHPGVKEIDAFLTELIDLGVESMIVDMRSYAGGTSYVPRFIAQRFIDKTVVYMNEYYPEGDGFIRKEWEIEPAGTGFREGKIALLSNGRTASGGEMFVMAMLQRDNLVHIGSLSMGATGNIVTKDLSNGWNFVITNSRTEFPDGKQYYKTGIAPEIIVKNDTTYGIDHFHDNLIEVAVEELVE